MRNADLLKFSVNTPIEDARKVMASVRHRYFPILDEKGRYCGVVSRRNLLNLHRKQIILVDHNEPAQAVDGLDQAEILEIIDHHRIGSLETGGPVYFRNEPVGCTATIIWRMYGEHGVEPPKKIAGLLLSAILSDTLMFRSPTSTPLDEAAARALAAARSAHSCAMARFSSSRRPRRSSRSAAASAAALRWVASMSRIACIKSFKSFIVTPRSARGIPAARRTARRESAAGGDCAPPCSRPHYSTLPKDCKRYLCNQGMDFCCKERSCALCGAQSPTAAKSAARQRKGFEGHEREGKTAEDPGSQRRI